MLFIRTKEIKKTAKWIVSLEGKELRAQYFGGTEETISPAVDNIIIDFTAGLMKLRCSEESVPYLGSLNQCAKNAGIQGVFKKSKNLKYVEAVFGQNRDRYLTIIDYLSSEIDSQFFKSFADIFSKYTYGQAFEYRRPHEFPYGNNLSEFDIIPLGGSRVSESNERPVPRCSLM